MRHLEIVLCGRSHALARLTQELEQMGHTAHLLTSVNAIDHCQLSAPDLLVDDASLSRALHYPSCPQLSLRVQSDDFSDAGASLHMHCLGRTGIRGWMALGRIEVAGDAAGNGADSSRQAIERVVELASLHISRFSRSISHFDEQYTQVEALDTLSSLIQLDRMKWQHRHNATFNEALLEEAKRPFVQRLADSLLANADRNALKVDGRGMSYAQLHAYSVAIQERLLPLLQAPTTGLTVIGISLPKALRCTRPSWP